MNVALRDVSLQLGKRPVLRSVSLDLVPSELVVVAGPNGAGKSVLLKLLAGILRPSSGSVLWDGRPAADRPAEYKFRLGYMPQALAFYEEQSAAACLGYFAQLKAIPAAWVPERVEAVLAATGLAHAARRKVRELSAGERARLGLGIALLNDPDLLLLDEPGAHLDPGERLALWELIGALKTGRSIVLATHVFAGLEGVADRLCVLEAGRVAHDCTVRAALCEAAPYVWSVTTDAAAPAQWPHPIQVISRRHAGGRTQWRLLAPGPPAEGAVQVPPTLEDAYLFVRWREVLKASSRGAL